VHGDILKGIYNILQWNIWGIAAYEHSVPI
jgi:hypothetical protein